MSDLHRDYVERTDQVRADLAFAAAWRRVEAALPEGWTRDLWQRREGGWIAAVHDHRGTTQESHDGPTPTEALIALAEALEKRP